MIRWNDTVLPVAEGGFTSRLRRFTIRHASFPLLVLPHGLLIMLLFSKRLAVRGLALNTVVCCLSVGSGPWQTLNMLLACAAATFTYRNADRLAVHTAVIGKESDLTELQRGRTIGFLAKGGGGGQHFGNSGVCDLFTRRVTPPMLTQVRRRKRLEFARQYSQWTAADWRRVAFSDKSHFQQHRTYGRQRVRQETHIIYVEGTLDRFGYESILGDHVHQYVTIVFPREGGIFQHDNAPCHTTRRVCTWLEEHDQNFKVLPCPNSPEFDSIGFLWDHLDLVFAVCLLRHARFNSCGAYRRQHGSRYPDVEAVSEGLTAESGVVQHTIAGTMGTSQCYVPGIWRRYIETGNVNDRPRSVSPKVTTPAQDRYVRINASRINTSTARKIRENLLIATDIIGKTVCIGHGIIKSGQLKNGSMLCSLMRQGLVLGQIPEGRGCGEDAVHRQGFLLCKKSMHTEPYRQAFGELFLLAVDNARTHRARVVDKYCQQAGIRRIICPALRPDMKCTKHAWDFCKNYHSSTPSPTQQCTGADISVQAERYNLKQEQLDNLIPSMPPRVRDLVFSRAISTLASHQGEPGSIPGRVTGFSQVGIVPDDAVGRRSSRGSPVSPAPSITLIGPQALAVKSHPNLFPPFPSRHLNLFENKMPRCFVRETPKQARAFPTGSLRDFGAWKSCPDDAAGWWVFSGFFRFPLSFVTAVLYTRRYRGLISCMLILLKVEVRLLQLQLSSMRCKSEGLRRAGIELTVRILVFGVLRRINCALGMRVKAVRDKVSTFEINLRKKSLPLPAYILAGVLSGMRSVKLATMERKWGGYPWSPSDVWDECLTAQSNTVALGVESVNGTLEMQNITVEPLLMARFISTPAADSLTRQSTEACRGEKDSIFRLYFSRINCNAVANPFKGVGLTETGSLAGIAFGIICKIICKFLGRKKLHVTWCLLGAVCTRRTEQEPVIRLEPGETECIAATHEKAIRHCEITADDEVAVEEMKTKHLSHLIALPRPRLKAALMIQANRARFPAGSVPDFGVWGSCRTTPMSGEFSHGSPVYPFLAFRRRRCRSPGRIKVLLRFPFGGIKGGCNKFSPAWRLSEGDKSNKKNIKFVTEAGEYEAAGTGMKRWWLQVIPERKPADQRHRPARFPRTKIRERPRQESNPVRQGETSPPAEFKRHERNFSTLLRPRNSAITIRKRLRGCLVEQVFTFSQNARQREKATCPKSPFLMRKHCDTMQGDTLKNHTKNCKDSSFERRRVMPSVHLSISMGTDSTGDYGEIVNAKDGMSDLCRAVGWFARNIHLPDFRAKYELHNKRDYDDSVDEVSDEKDGGSPDDSNELIDRLKMTVEKNRAQQIHKAEWHEAGAFLAYMRCLELFPPRTIYVKFKSRND
ncbi:hypothetical protein PR048_029234 [Dryococelus australis]|uniref:Tc1-like transposase DDE domain-containing protein n=1 Tax=Dryococelus australis TaxID=614101 RepID=A0ABQ9GCU8_9NEOP|nr:hypothetical protein PR048_029234 [Dryococelus australis]